MFFADKPYISDFFKQTVRDNNIPVVGTEIAEKLGLYSGTKIISEEAAIEMARKSGDIENLHHIRKRYRLDIRTFDVQRPS